MSELDTFEALRPDVTPLSPEERATMRAQLFGASTQTHSPQVDDDRQRDRQAETIGPVHVAPDGGTGPVSSRPRRSRRVALVGAAAAAAVGVLAIASVTGRDRPDEPAVNATQPAVVGPEDSTLSMSDPSVGVAVPGVDDLTDATGFMLPSVIPDGLEITGLSAGRTIAPWGNPFGATRWARLDSNGSVDGVLSVRPPRPIDADIDEDTTVRSVPAEAWSQDGRAGVLWNENDRQMSATAKGLSSDELLAAVEALDIDVDTASVSFGDGGAALGLVAEEDLSFVDDNVVVSTVEVGHLGERDAATLFAVAEPNTFGQTLDEFVDAEFADSEQGWQPRTMNGIDTLVRAMPADRGGGADVTWIADGYEFRVHATTGLDDAIDFAAGLKLTSAALFSQAGEELVDRRTNELSAWAELDRITFDDGLQATVRSQTAESGADAICVEAPVQQCRAQVSEASIVDGYSDNVFDTFDINGQNVVIGWQSTSEADRLGEPTIRPGDTLNPADGLGLTTSADIDQLIDGQAGRFLEIRVPDGERAPGLTFRSGDNVLDVGAPPIRTGYDY